MVSVEHDSMATPDKTCAARARKLLGFLGLPDWLPPPCNVHHKQVDGLCCGLWCRHFGEEEIRLFRGEGRWSQRLSLSASFDQLNAIKSAFRQKLSKAERNFKGDGMDFKSEKGKK